MTWSCKHISHVIARTKTFVKCFSQQDKKKRRLFNGLFETPVDCLASRSSSVDLKDLLPFIDATWSSTGSICLA